MTSAAAPWQRTRTIRDFLKLATRYITEPQPPGKNGCDHCENLNPSTGASLRAVPSDNIAIK
uniref:Uncharacterized protein n=1 Tax=Timema bartmani TaxID=61472 RepID=A0A7R9I0M0_9NEOP|nr:unnamed protein product [Timema bartmani]